MRDCVDGSSTLLDRETHSDFKLVPTLRVGMPTVTLRVTKADAERPGQRSPAERGSDQ